MTTGTPPSDPKAHPSPEGKSGQLAPSDKLVNRIEKEVGPLIPQPARKEVLRKVSAIVHRETQLTFQGPIPPPDYLEGYERAVPGCADRIIKMAETSLAHEITFAQQAQKDDNADRRLGLIFGFAALCVIIVAATVCAVLEHPIFAGGLILTGVVGVVARFISGRSGPQQTTGTKNGSTP